MHIVYISQEYPPSQRAGGIASYVKEIASGMLQLGHQITVITASDDTRVFSDNIEEGIRIIRLAGGAFFVQSVEGGSNFKKLRCIYRYYTYRKKIFKILKSLGSIDIVEVADYDAEGLYLGTLPFPVILRLHTPSLLNRNTLKKSNAPFWKLHQFIRLRSEEIVFNKAKYVTSCSQSLLDWVNTNLHFIPSKVAVIRNPIAFNDCDNKVVSYNCSKPNELTIFYAGTISITKGVGELYKACTLLNRKGIKIKLLLAGKQGAFGSHLKEIAAKNQDNWCHFLGNLPRRQLYSYYSSADICCFPSWWENMPMVCLEAMRCGAIVLGSSSGGMKEIITDGENGFLIQPKNVELLANKLLHISMLNKQKKRKFKNRRTPDDTKEIQHIYNC